MDKRLTEWLETKGRRLAELKASGGEEFFVPGPRNLKKLNNLTGDEWIEFFTLIGQLDGLVYLLKPANARSAKKFEKAIAERMQELENECRHIFELTGSFKILKGYA